MRKLPIYFLLGTSESMTGEPIEAARQGLDMFVSTLTSEPKALEMAFLSVISFGDTAQQIVPLTDLHSFKVPDFNIGGDRALGAALELLDERLDEEIERPSGKKNGDWKPIIFVMIDGLPTDDWDRGAEKIKNRSVSIVAMTSGFDTDAKMLRKLTANVIELKSASKNDLTQFIRYEDQSLPIDAPNSNV